MKILYLDLNVQYQNPTRNSIPLLLKDLGDLFIYGLGYQPEFILKKGIEDFYETNGPFDIIATNEHVVFGTLDVLKNQNYTKAYKKNYFFQFDAKQIQNYLMEAFTFFQNIKNNKLIFLLESDYYNFQEYKIDRLQKLESYIVFWGKDFISEMSVLEDLQKESFSKKVNNNWYYFVQKYNKIISLPHFVNSNEFYFECLANRKNSVYVAGVNYYHRKKTLEVLKSSQYKTDDKKIYSKIYSLMRKLKLKPDAHPVLMRLYNVLFRNEIEQAKYVFTCGSGLEWPIRKFFEVPALGSVLLAKPFYNADKLGFIDGVNYIKTDYKDIVEKIDWLENNQCFAQEIAKNGQDMIWEKHSLKARVKQLQKSIEAILEDRFDGSYWEDGEFYVRYKSNKG